MKDRIREHWPLLLILGLALALRLLAMGRQPLWLDELFSLECSAGNGLWTMTLPRDQVLSPAPRTTMLEGASSVWSIYWSQARDPHPPLYFMLLRVWREAFGSSTEALRSLSTVWSLGMVVAMYAIGREVAGRRGAIVAAALAALAVQQAHYGAEVRGYMMAVACVAVAMWAALRIRGHGWSWARGATLASAAMIAVGTNYLAVLPLAATALYLALETRGTDRRRSLATVAVAVALSAAWLTPLVVEQARHVERRNNWLVASEPRTLADLAIDTALALGGQIAPLQERSMWACYLAAGILLVAAGPLYARNARTRLFLLVLLAVLGGLAAMDLAENKSHLKEQRYALLFSPALFGLLAVLARRDPGAGPTNVGRAVSLVPYAAVLLTVVSLPAVGQMTREDWTEPVRFFDQHASPGDLFVVAGNLDGHQTDWEHGLYMGLTHFRGERKTDVVLLSRRPFDAAAIRAEAVRRGGLAVVGDYGFNVQEIYPPGWRRAAIYNFFPMGMLTVIRPPPTEGTPSTTRAADVKAPG